MKTRRKNGLYIAAIIAVFGWTLTLFALPQGDAEVENDLTVGGTATVTTSVECDSITAAGDVGIQSTGAGVNINTHSDAGDDFAVNTSAFVVEGDTGRVGLGTATPNIYGSGTGRVISIYDPTDAATSRGILELVGAHGTAAASDAAGDILFLSENNAGDKRAVIVSTTLEGSGGVNGFGGKITFSTKQDNSTSFNSLVMDSSGNFGFGTTTKSWASTYTALQFGGLGCIAAQNGDVAGKFTLFGQNMYYDSADDRWEYIVADEASYIQLINGEVIFGYASAGASAGDPITFSQSMTIDSSGNVTFAGTTIDMTTSGTTLTVGTGADNGTVSAGVFVDRTKYYDGDALKEIEKIKGKDGHIDHDTLPTCAQATITKIDKETGEAITTKGRDLGAMISVLTKAVQQLAAENDDLKARIAILENQ